MHPRVSTAVALACAIAAGSCYQDDSTGPDQGKPIYGRPFTTAEIADSPFPYDSVARVDLLRSPDPGQHFPRHPIPVYQLYSGPQALVYGRAVGTARIMVSGDGSSTTLFIRVVPGVPPVVSSVTISPPAASIARNDTLGLFATARDPLGAPIANRTYSWTISDTLVARLVSVAGVGNNYAIVRGINAGTATVSTSADGKMGTATITVNP